MKQIPYHPAANIFPLMTGGAFDKFVEDIRENGLAEPIALLDGKILDGRNRYRACRAAGVEPRFREVEIDNPVAHVLSLNLHRRHLTKSQQALIGAKSVPHFTRAAKERQRHHGGTAPGKNKSKQNTYGKNAMSDSSSDNLGSARDQAAAAVGVSPRMIDKARKLVEAGEPELVAAVDEGRMSLGKALVLAGEAPAVQRQKAATPERPANVTISRKRAEEIRESAGKLVWHLNQPTIYVSTREAKMEAEKLQEMVSRILS